MILTNEKQINMKTVKLNSYAQVVRICTLVFLIFVLNSCDDELLEEKPLSSLNTDNVLTSKKRI